jgi:hypothetical protein
MLAKLLRKRLDEVDGLLVDLEEMRGQRQDQLAKIGFTPDWAPMRNDGPWMMYTRLIIAATDRQRKLEFDIRTLEML